jgi:hypothetical protein
VFLAGTGKFGVLQRIIGGRCLHQTRHHRRLWP